MNILILRTDQPEAEIGLYNDRTKVVYQKWAAHRQLAETIHIKIAEITANLPDKLASLDAIAVYKGPGSFTGLRIGLAVANALASSQNMTIVGEGGEDWLTLAIDRILRGENELQVLPEYGALPNITAPRK